MVKLAENWTSLQPEEYIGLSTDTKPVENNGQTVQAMATFYEYNTRNMYVFDGVSAWHLM